MTGYSIEFWTMLEKWFISAKTRLRHESMIAILLVPYPFSWISGYIYVNNYIVLLDSCLCTRFH